MVLIPFTLNISVETTTPTIPGIDIPGDLDMPYYVFTFLKNITIKLLFFTDVKL